MQRIVLEGRCAKCQRLLFERSVEDQGLTHDLPVVCPDCDPIIVCRFFPHISIKPIIQAVVD